MMRLEERDRCGTDRHKQSLNLGYTRVKEVNRISLTGKIENLYALLALGGECLVVFLDFTFLKEDHI